MHTYANRGRVLYLVFSKALQVTESQYMTGADMHGTVSVATLGSLAWQHTQECHGGRVVPVLELSAEDVRFESPAFAKVVSKTIERFAQSVDECITTAHVPRRLQPRPNGLPYAPLYVAHVALEVWSRLRQARSVITPHDRPTFRITASEDRATAVCVQETADVVQDVLARTRPGLGPGALFIATIATSDQ